MRVPAITDSAEKTKVWNESLLQTKLGRRWSQIANPRLSVSLRTLLILSTAEDFWFKPDLERDFLSFFFFFFRPPAASLVDPWFHRLLFLFYHLNVITTPKMNLQMFFVYGINFVRQNCLHKFICNVNKVFSYTAFWKTSPNHDRIHEPTMNICRKMMFLKSPNILQRWVFVLLWDC